MSHDSTGKGWGDNVTLTVEDGVAWVTLNRPDKRNAINPGIVYEMTAVMDALEGMDEAEVIVITGAGNAFSAGQDLKEYFRETEAWPPHERDRLFAMNAAWQWRRTMFYRKPTIAMVNGWCFGGAFVPLVSCDLSLAAEDAQFGLSEINWGIIPGGNVTRSLAAKVNQSDALYYIMTGEPFDGRKAKEMGLVNEVLPADKLRARTVQLAKILMAKNPVVLNAAKLAYKHSDEMNWETAEDYLSAKAAQATLFDPTKGMMQGISQFLDDKTYKPGLSSYRIEEE